MDLTGWFVSEIVPLIRADGGWLEIISAGEDAAELAAKGECAHCAALDRCLKWVQEKAGRDLKRDIRFSVRREPFLWRK